jgi:hypothetical protein
LCTEENWEAGTIETIKVLLQAATFITLLVGLGFTFWQVRLFRISHEDLHDWNRRHAAQKATDEMVPRLSKDTLLIEEKFQILTNHDRIPLKTILEECKKDPAVRGALNRPLNYFESLASGVHQGVYDELLIKNSYQQLIGITLNQFSAYIDHLRGRGYSTFCTDIEGMTKRWEQEDNKINQRDKLGQTSIRARKSKGG